MITTEAPIGMDIALNMNKIIMQKIQHRPLLRILDLDNLSEEDLKGYLLSKRSVTWGKMYTISSEDTLANCVGFLRKELDNIYRYVVGNLDG